MCVLHSCKFGVCCVVRVRSFWVFMVCKGDRLIWGKVVLLFPAAVYLGEARYCIFLGLDGLGAFSKECFICMN